MNGKDVIIYYVVDGFGSVYCYYYGGILSKYFCKKDFLHFCKKFPYKDFFFKQCYLSTFIEYFEEHYEKKV